ncbi:MAG: hypothetical protein KKH34_09750, partial [Candidatus Omnitrophica bacterium]|nr:hypothetical protein [Candidatus Omnitrophota bacterium]
DKTKENWGIEPLPNLDFKIMQGNSLLEEYEGVKLFDEKLIASVDFDKQKLIESIKQKQSELQKEYLDLHAKNKLTKIKRAGLNEELRKLDKQLKGLNKQDNKTEEAAGLFDAQNEAKQKREMLKRLHKEFFETNEKEIKGKIKTQIEKIGWDLIEATLKEQNKISELKKIEKFKKSNTKPFFLWKLHFADVFEKGGFDIVIANPPYGANIPKEELSNIKLKLKDTNNLNSAAIFIDFGKNYLITTNGILSFIVPKSLLYSERWFSLVESMLGNVPILVDVEKAFENVKLEQVVFLYGHIIKKNSYLARKFLNNEFVSSTVISNDIPLGIKAWICDVSEFELSILKKLRNGSLIPLGSISETKRGVGLQEFLKDKGNYPVIGGINISRYCCRGIKGYLAKEDFENQKQKVAFMRQPKIISQDLIAHIQNPNPHILIASCLDLNGETFGLDTVQNTIINDNNYDIRYILGLLNCKFISWYTYKFIYCCAIRTMHFDNYYIGKILIPDISIENQKPFIEIVDKILAITKSSDYLENPAKKEEVKEYEKQIDQMVYKLYNLTDEEIKIVEGNER